MNRRATRRTRSHETGLVRGKKKGIGLPDTGKPDPTSLYTLDLTSKDTTRYVSSEAGGEPVVVVTIEEGFPDALYAESGYGAQIYGADAPPVRGVPAGPPVVGTPPNTELWSFTLPMTPRSRQGLTQFINQGKFPPAQQ